MPLVPQTIAFYPAEVIRIAIVDALYADTSRTILQQCDIFGIEKSVFYHMKGRRMPIPGVFLRQLGLWKVCDGQRIIGYAARGPIHMEDLWRGL